MTKHILYNIFLNIGILVLAYCSIAAYNEKQFFILGGCIIGIALLVYLKVRLAKKVRQHIKQGKQGK
ncbi:DUF6358 family protein [Olivibacter sp. SDN3]|uniref:DUF6358 family protein n=1 Tax=Olivibacter sp. SDN3 TaxID=2764720 RepID=UPI001C9E2F7D